MKYNHRQRLEMAYHGVDADELENPKQKLPPVKKRMEKLERRIKEGHPRSDDYEKQLQVYRTLIDPSRAKEKKGWDRFWGWLNG